MLLLLLLLLTARLKDKLHMRLLITCLLFVVSITVGGCKESAVPKSGEPGPAISCNDINGDYFSLSQLKGKTVVLFFWSSKCCSEKVKELESLYLKNKSAGLDVVAVEVGGSKDALASFVKGNNLTFTNLTDEYQTISRSYRVIGFPTTFLLDKKGIISRKISGEITAEHLARLVSELL